MPEDSPKPKTPAELFQEAVGRLYKEAREHPYKDFSKPPAGLHDLTLKLPEWPQHVGLVFTLDKDSLRDDTSPDHWHLSMQFINGERVPDDIARQILKVFFPAGGMREAQSAEAQSRIWLVEVETVH